MKVLIAVPKNRSGLMVHYVYSNYQDNKNHDEDFEEYFAETRFRVGDGGPRRRDDWDVYEKIFPYDNLEGLIVSAVSFGAQLQQNHNINDYISLYWRNRFARWLRNVFKVITSWIEK